MKEKMYLRVLIALYSIAILTCFICSIAVSHTLSWFFIVLVSLALAFSVTNLPFLVKKYKTLITAAAVSILIYILLFTCSVYLPDGWLTAIAYPIATIAIIAAWLVLLTIKYLRVNWLLKIGMVFLILSVNSVAINLFCDYYLINNTNTIDDYLNLYHWRYDQIANKITFWGLACIGAVEIIAGMIVALRNRNTLAKSK